MTTLIMSEKTPNKKPNALNRINHYMKQNQKELFSSSITSHFSCCPPIWMIFFEKSTENNMAP